MPISLLKKNEIMKTEKMSIAKMEGKLSRKEMKDIMAGSGGDGCATYYCGAEKKSCCSSSDWCSNASSSGVCVKR